MCELTKSLTDAAKSGGKHSDAKEKIKDIGFYSKKEAEAVVQEIEDFVETINKRDGKRFDISVAMGISIFYADKGETAPDGDCTFFNANPMALKVLTLRCIESIKECE